MSVEAEIAKLSGVIIGMKEGVNQRLDDQRTSIEGLRGSVGKTFDKIEDLRKDTNKMHEKVIERLAKNEQKTDGLADDIEDDVKPSIEKLDKKIDKRSTAVGGVSGASSSAIIIGLKSLWDYISTGGSN